MRRLLTSTVPGGLLAALLALAAGCGGGGGDDDGCTLSSECPGAEVCIDGTCQPGAGDAGSDAEPGDGGDCPAGFERCGGECVATERDTDNCGRCGNVCEAPPGASATCQLGRCGFECPGDLGDCNDLAEDGCETDLTSSDAHCGACGDPCEAGQICEASACVRSPFGGGSDGELVVDSGAEVGIETSLSPLNAEAGGTELQLNRPDGFAAGQIVLLHQSRGPNTGRWAVRRINELSGSLATVDEALEQGFSTGGGSLAQAMVLPQHTSVSITSGTLTAPAWDGSVGGIVGMVATESITIGAGGAVEASALGYRGHDTMFATDGFQGEGPPGRGSASTAANGAGGGGGAPIDTVCDQSGGGGGGGHGTAGSPGGSDCAAVGSGGEAAGDPMHAALLFGGAGGSGGGGQGSGDGGGIVYLAAPQIVVEGAIRSHGGAGTASRMLVTNCIGGGGGGAGGAIHLVADTATLGDGRVTAAGGSGGTGGCGVPGGDGGAGRIAVRATDAVTGSTDPALVELP